MILYVTSFNERLYEVTGRDMISSFIYVKTEGDMLATYEGDVDLPSHRKIIPYSLDDDKFLNDWLQDNADVIPTELGGDFSGEMDKYNFRASQWFRKIAALNVALKFKDKYEAIVFVDSDTVFRRTIREEYMLSVFGDAAMFYHLGPYREEIDAGIESGFIGFHMKNGGVEFLETVFSKFQDKSYRNYRRWDDSYVFHNTVKENTSLKLKDVCNPPSREVMMAPGGGGLGRAIPYGPFVGVIKHKKGIHWQQHGVKFE